MQAEHIAFGIDSESDEAILADGHFIFVKPAACFCHTGCLDSTIIAHEVDNRAIAA